MIDILPIALGSGVYFMHNANVWMALESVPPVPSGAMSISMSEGA